MLTISCRLRSKITCTLITKKKPVMCILHHPFKLTIEYLYFLSISFISKLCTFSKLSHRELI